MDCSTTRLEEVSAVFVDAPHEGQLLRSSVFSCFALSFTLQTMIYVVSRFYCIPHSRIDVNKIIFPSLIEVFIMIYQGLKSKFFTSKETVQIIAFFCQYLFSWLDQILFVKISTSLVLPFLIYAAG